MGYPDQRWEGSGCAERLGALLDGEKGLLRVTTKRSLDLMSLGAWLRQKGSFATTALQVYAGKAVHCAHTSVQEMFVLSDAGDLYKYCPQQGQGISHHKFL